MCGIVGSISRGPALGVDVFLSMRDILSHRGPDDAGLWSSTDGRVLLGHRRLAILDLSLRGHQPMHDLSGNLTIVFNGEIYNFVELREELNGSFHFRSKSDTEVLLAAYDAWGTDCLRHLNGMFAFAIWDQRRQSLFAARDRFGEKPFYYFRNREAFLFASEVKSLLASRLIQSEANNSAVYRYLAYRETDATHETFLKNVFSLSPAQALVYSPARNTLRTWQYWDLDPNRTTRFATDREYAECLLDLLKESVALRLRSDVTVGSSLSGGIDSSSIVGLVSKRVNGNGQTIFSARFDDPSVDEGAYIRRVLERFSITGHSVRPDPLRLLDEMDQFAWHQEHPFSSTSVYAQWCVMRLAQENGVTVLLDGQGADENLAGYVAFHTSYFRDLLRQRRWSALVLAATGHLRSFGVNSLAVALAPMLPSWIIEPLKRSREPLGLRPEFERAWASPPSRVPTKYQSALHDDLYQQLRCTMLPKLLRFADRNSMAFSREVRLPFLDHRIVEYLFSTPEDQKIKGTINKRILRRAMRGIVPDEILRRTDKKGFDTPQAQWLAGPLRSWAEHLLFSQEFCQRDWVDPVQVHRTWREFLSHPPRHHGLLLRLLSLEMWAKLFLKPWRVSRRLSTLRPADTPCVQDNAGTALRGL
jgi:asparagine synthase (glutamine-hydrolysing)